MRIIEIGINVCLSSYDDEWLLMTTHHLNFANFLSFNKKSYFPGHIICMLQIYLKINLFFFLAPSSQTIFKFHNFPFLQ